MSFKANILSENEFSMKSYNQTMDTLNLYLAIQGYITLTVFHRDTNFHKEDLYDVIEQVKQLAFVESSKISVMAQV
jgi:UDP-N-acetylglucosamine 2-epimerase